MASVVVGLMHGDGATWSLLMDTLAHDTVRYLRAQVEAGAQAVQVFDSWAGALDPDDYVRFVLPTMREVFTKLDMPRTFIVGDRGEALVDADGLRAAGVRVVTIAGAGHLMMDDQPAAFVEALAAALPD